MRSPEMFSLQGKTALVTGAAGGIGFDMAVALGEAGAKIAFNCRNEEHMKNALAKYAEYGISAEGYIGDVTDEARMIEIVHEIEEKNGGLDILVNNAGIQRRYPMTEFPTEVYREVIDIDLIAPFMIAKAVLPGMIERRSGKIINVCSMQTHVVRETIAAYASAKGGLGMLTKNIASEFGKYNIQCNGIGPGYIATDMTSALREPAPDGTPNPFNEFICARTPAARWGLPDDLKGPIVFLASPASDFVNGHILYVDGGILAYFGKVPS